MDGIVLINKEKGISSFGVVAKIRKIFNIKKVGHCGTLDPEATGVLPVMIGNATKISKYLVEHDKEYVAVLKFGIKTDSADGEGSVIEEDGFLLKKDCEKEYRDIIEKMVGKHKQVPPMYSAIKVNGKKLYEYARAGQEIERKGTYIRTLCETIAKNLGTIGFMKSLQRTKVDKFSIENSVTLSEVEDSVEKTKYIISIEEIFQKNESIILNNRKKELFLNGVQLSFELEDGIYRIYSNQNFIGIGTVKNKLLKRDVIV